MVEHGPISLRVHAAIDVGLVAVGVTSPWLFGFSQNLLATAYVLAMTVFGLAINSITDYPVGLFRRLPLIWHRRIELTAPLPFCVLPWFLLKAGGAAPMVLTVIGAVIFANAALTRPRPAQIQA